MDQAGRAENRLFQAALSMSDIFLDGLPVLDGLEITGSPSRKMSLMERAA